ncbi:hypothetical protein AYO38_06355 [bacterium SCGC AG-212-C10]|nr:hypothetical protein AYO38_06355 [bacterium SCGC AG-212-C10]
MSARPTSVLDREHLPYPDVVAVYEMTEQEYLDWDHEGGLADWVDGKVYHYMVASKTHQTIVQFLSSLLGFYGELTNAGRVLAGPYAMRTLLSRRWREPDLMFIAAEHSERSTEQGLIGPADLVVEVVSPGSPRRDRVDKLAEYAALGVREYWVIDPRIRQRRATFYVLDDSGKYNEGQEATDGSFHSTVAQGFWLRSEWLWDPSPNAPRRLAEILGVAPFVMPIGGDKGTRES